MFPPSFSDTLYRNQQESLEFAYEQSLFYKEPRTASWQDETEDEAQESA